jgi:dihydrofolate reductase
MSRVMTSMSMSLDGFVTGPDDSRENPFGKGGDVLHDWLFKNKSDEDVAILTEMINDNGAVVMGRWSFDKCVDVWGPNGPVDGGPCFVVTHNAPTESYPSGYKFVTDGVASAIEQAKAAAGDKVVGLHGATMPQQALELGLLDEIHIAVVPVLLGGGTRMFDHLGGAITLERTRVVDSPGATHLFYKVVR